MKKLEVGDRVRIKNFDTNNRGLITAKSGLSGFEIKLDNGKYTYTGQLGNLVKLRKKSKVKNTLTEELERFKEFTKSLLEELEELKKEIKTVISWNLELEERLKVKTDNIYFEENKKLHKALEFSRAANETWVEKCLQLEEEIKNGELTQLLKDSQKQTWVLIEKHFKLIDLYHSLTDEYLKLKHGSNHT